MKTALIFFTVLTLGASGAFYYLRKEPALLPVGPRPSSLIEDLATNNETAAALVEMGAETEKAGPLTMALDEINDVPEPVFGKEKSVYDLPEKLSRAIVSSSPPPDSFVEKAILEYASGVWRNPHSWSPFDRLEFAGVVVIHGHADRVRGQQFNQELSTRRADAVSEEIERRYSIPGNRIVIAGFGEDHPIEVTDDDIESQKNRRVEVYIYR